MDYLPLGGRWRGFTPRASVSSSITHRCVVLVFASLFPYLCLLFWWVLLFWLYYYCLYEVCALCSVSWMCCFIHIMFLVFCHINCHLSLCDAHCLLDSEILLFIIIFNCLFEGKSGFVSHTKHTAEATNVDLFHSWLITCIMWFWEFENKIAYLGAVKFKTKD